MPKDEGKGTASKQGARQRSNWPGDEALVGHFAQVVSGDYAGLYGVVQSVETTDKDGQPETARFEIRSRPQPGLEIPEADGTGSITVDWADLRKSVAGLR